jgi:hypothetical protein
LDAHGVLSFSTDDSVGLRDGSRASAAVPRKAHAEW